MNKDLTPSAQEVEPLAGLGEASPLSMADTLKAIRTLAHKHEVQYWLDAPGTDAEKLAKIMPLVWDAEEIHAEMVKALKALRLECLADPKNPCWDNRPTDIPGRHWGGGAACTSCNARTALAKAGA
jgi:hypothetical protein